MRRLAANIIITAGGDLVKNAMLELDDMNCVVRIARLSEFSNEPSMTLFYNGVLSRYPSEGISIGVDLRMYDGLYLCVGDIVDDVALWKNIDLEALLVEERTEIIKL